MDKLLDAKIVDKNCLAFTIQWEKDGRSYQKNISITPEEAVGMTDDAPAKSFQPRKIDGFNWVLGEYVRELYQMDLISYDVYTDFIKKRLESDIKRYFPKPSGRAIRVIKAEWYPTGYGGRTSDAAIDAYNNRKDFCDDFLFYYFPVATQTRYKKDDELSINMIKEYAQECCDALEETNMLSDGSVSVVEDYRTGRRKPESLHSINSFDMEEWEKGKKFTHPITRTVYYWRTTPDYLLAAFRVAVREELKRMKESAI